MNELNSSPTKGFLLTLLSGVLWGSTYPVIKVLEVELSPYEIAFYRALLATATIAFYFKGTKHGIFFLPKQSNLKFLLPLSILGASGFWISLNLAIQLTAANVASFLVATYPLLGAFLSVIFLKEKMNTLKGIGFVLGIAGTYFVVVYGSTNGIHNLSTNHFLGDIIAILTSLSWSFYMVLTKKFYNKNLFSPNYATFHTFSLAVVPLFIIMLFTSNVAAVTRASWVSIAGLLWLGIICSGIAFLAFNMGMKTVKMQVAAANQFMFPVVALVLSYVLLNEPITFLSLLGIVMILLGILVTQMLAEQKTSLKRILKNGDSKPRDIASFWRKGKEK
jgi:drug/metabolite transporter (DMT)-like permease